MSDFTSLYNKTDWMHKVLGFQSRYDSNTSTLNQMASMENHGPWTPHEPVTPFQATIVQDSRECRSSGHFRTHLSFQCINCAFQLFYWSWKELCFILFLFRLCLTQLCNLHRGVTQHAALENKRRDGQRQDVHVVCPKCTTYKLERILGLTREPVVIGRL